MSLSSAFHSRRSFGDSAHEPSHDSKEAGVIQGYRENLSMTVSGPLNTERSVGSECETNGGDSTMFLPGHCAEDLDLAENAILRILSKGVRASESERNDEAGATMLKEVPGMGEHLEGSKVVSSAGSSVDLQLLSRLLDQVQTSRDPKYIRQNQVGRSAARSSNSPSGGIVWDFCNQRNDKERRLKDGDMKKAVEAAALAAKSAADAAKLASSLSTRNSEVVNTLLQSSSTTTSKQEKQVQKENQKSHSDSSDSDQTSELEETENIAKKIVAQNRYTHVVLGVMLVSSFVWRYIVVKVAKRVRNKASDPLGYVQGKLTDNFMDLGQKEQELEHDPDD